MDNSLERKYIQLLKKKIEEALALDNSNSTIKASDLQYVAKVVQEKSGVVLSLSTLKRFWKENFAQLPQPTTLNALVKILDYNNWQEFKQVNSIKSDFPLKKVTLVSVTVILIIGITFILLFFNKAPKTTTVKAPIINGPVSFTTKKTVKSGLPNTVIFKYDVSHVKADSFFFQQTWRKHFRQNIDPKGNAITTIYYESGYHRAYLFANDSIIAMQPVYILSNGWEPHIYYSNNDLIPIDFSKEKLVENGVLHLNKSVLEKHHVDLTRYFFTRIVNSREFNVSSDNFNFDCRVKLDSLKYSECPWINIILVNEKNMFMIKLVNIGCEHYAYYKLGETERPGSKNDLSELGLNVYQWQQVGIRVKNKDAVININGKDCYHEKFEEGFGKIVDLIFIFERTGSIDYVRLSDENNKLIFDSEFN